MVVSKTSKCIFESPLIEEALQDTCSKANVSTIPDSRRKEHLDEVNLSNHMDHNVNVFQRGII